MKRFLLVVVGLIFLVLGAIGVALPILPTVLFLFVASICFVKSSERINTWFENTNLYKKHVVRFINQKGMTLKMKLFIIIPVYVIYITLCILTDILAMRIVICTLLIIKTIVFIKIKTIKEPNITLK